jgi:uncharacterized protein
MEAAHAFAVQVVSRYGRGVMDKEVIPDLRKLLDAVFAGSTSRQSFLHGEGHWKCVAWTGLQLCQAIPEVDCGVVFLFGLFHDTQRLNDGHDPDHGRRAGKYLRQLHGEVFRLRETRLDLLTQACNAHADGLTTTDPTIGACWDADRLNLWRVGTKPSPKFLSTAPAKRTDAIARAEKFEGQRMTWEAIYLAY